MSKAAIESFYQVFLVFLRLGCTSFGGPVAHIGFFRTAFVDRKKWLSDSQFAELLSLCQFIPGPASSQLGMAIGYQRCGYHGALAAWLGFTLPSAAVLTALAVLLQLQYADFNGGALAGLKLVALSVVVHAFLGMRSSLAPDWPRILVMLACTVLFILWQSYLAPIVVLCVVGVLSAGVKSARLGDRLRDTRSANLDEGTVIRPSVSLSKLGIPVACLCVFLVLLLIPLGMPSFGVWFDQMLAYYRSGALVFGGGHVVLPLLETEVVATQWVDKTQFLAGYGAAQAVPGPLFTFASFLGASHSEGATGVLGAVVATVCIFLPSFLLLFGVLPFWSRLKQLGPVNNALYGISAGVLGLLLATIYDPILKYSVTSLVESFVAIAAFLVLRYTKVPIVLVVALGGAFGWLIL